MDLLNLSPLVFHSSLLLPSSTFGSQEKSIWPRCVSDVDMVGKAWKVCCTFRRSYKVFVLRLYLYSKKEGLGPLWLECTPTHLPDLNLSFNRSYSHENVRFIFCTNFRLLYSKSSVSSLDQISWFNTVQFFDSEPCVLNLLFFDIQVTFYLVTFYLDNITFQVILSLKIEVIFILFLVILKITKNISTLQHL